MIRALAIIALASPAAAQSIPVDAHRIDRCLGVMDHPMSCVGVAADECIAENGNGPNVIVAACHFGESDFWDAALNDVYADVLALAADRETDDLGYTPGALTNALRDMQRKWIDFRDATCAHAVELAKPFGSAAGAAEAECVSYQTAQQYFALRGIWHDYRQR